MRRHLILAVLLVACGAASGNTAPKPVKIPEACRQFQRQLTIEARNLFGLDAPIAVLAAQMHQESGCNPAARSRVGAGGLTQFMPATAQDLAKRYPNELGPADPFSPRWAIGAQVRYMRDLIRARDKRQAKPLTECARWWFGLRDYNGGSGWTERERRKAQAAGADPDNPLAVEPFNAGRAPANHHENTDYPRRILLRIAPAYTAGAWGRSADCALASSPSITQEFTMPGPDQQAPVSDATRAALERLTATSVADTITGGAQTLGDPLEQNKPAHVASTSDARTCNNVMRHEYRILSELEKQQMQQLKDMGLAFYHLLHAIGGTDTNGDRLGSRHLALAGTAIEEAVMWGVKHITGPAKGST